MKAISIIIFIFFISSCGKEPGYNYNKDPKTSSQIGAQANCTTEYAPVCGQPPMPPCPQGMMCAQVMPPVKTYQNRCFMGLESATFMSDGPCQGNPL